MIFINFKTYERGTGQKALELIKIIEEVAKNSGVKLIPVVQSTDIKEAVISTTLEIWAQKIDPVTYGASTGAIIPQAVAEDGAGGVFLNHSECRYANFEDLTQAVALCKQANLKTLIFAKDLEELKMITTLKPDFVSYEPPELIGSTTISVSGAKPEVISQAVDIANNAQIPLIVGAGIKTEKDISVSLSLGASGFAIASSIVTSDNPKEILLELTGGYQ